jgi:hypothetical protein
VGVLLHERRRTQHHRVEPARGEDLLDRVLGAEEVDRMVGTRAIRGDIDEALHAGIARGLHEVAMAAVVDMRRGVPAAAEHAVGAGEDALDADERAGQRGGVGEVAGDHLGAERGEVGSPGRMPVERAHRDALVEQEPDRGSAECAGGADDERLHGREGGAGRGAASPSRS